MGSAPNPDNETIPEWRRLKGQPYDERLRLTRVSGNVSELETPTGYRYRCVSEDGVKHWLSFRKNWHMKRATKSEVKICCKKLQRSFGTFVDRPNGVGAVRIFPKRSGLTGLLSRGIKFCPWCGKELEFLQSEETEGSRAHTAKAGARSRD